MDQISLQSNAKINLFLAILGVLPNGYCDIYSIMFPINFYDKITLSIFPGSGIHSIHQTSQLQFDPCHNSILDAVKFFQKMANISFHTDISIHKNIPIGGGLGGGSSNAGIILKNLNTHFGYPLSDQQILSIASKIGCDVPFFLENKAKIATHTGSNLQDIPSPLYDYIRNQSVLIFKPNFEISTSWAYSQFKQKPQFFSKKQLPSFTSPFDLNSFIFNSFSPIIFDQFPTLQTLFNKLTAHHFKPSISGSGSCCFLLENDPQRLIFAQNIINQSGLGTSCGIFNFL